MDIRKLFVLGVALCLIVTVVLQKPYDEKTDGMKGKSSTKQGREARDSSSASFPFCRLDFEVFLSFNAEDVGLNFADHLYNALVNGGFRTFRDEGIEIGEDINEAHQSAIRQSKIAIPILSKNYACVECLSELTVIMDRRVEGQITVMPVFYHVSPWEVRHQNGHFETAFRNHDKTADTNTALEWRKAMRLVGELRGWVAADWVEGKLTEEIVDKIQKRLRNAPCYIVSVKKRIE